ncbi:hybrid sensor histidine kinase/response regulator [Aliiglaciecola litoralis]|uniref:histidine kinase n=1 Tax=Aliiglaciecola litoralis TaxID=582857 RepID=A0ABP3X615_9ALTE
MLNTLSRYCLSVMTIFNLSWGVVFASEYNVELLDENNGFASSIIFSIVQDKNGYLWFGTGYDGLMRYDGKNVQRFQHDPNDPFSLPHNNAGNLTLDSEGNLWIGSWGGGAFKYEQSTDKFTQYQYDVSDPQSISSRKIQNIFEDVDGDIWLGSGDYGLNKFNPEQQSFTRYSYGGPHETPVPSGTADGRIWDIAQTSADMLWTGTNRGLTSFNKTTETFTSFIPNPDVAILGHNKIRHIIEGRGNTLFLGTDDGVLSFDQQTQAFTVLEIENHTSIGPIYSLIKTNFNQYWVTSNRGVFSFSEDNLTLKKVPLGFDDQCSQTLFQDRQGIIWLTCEGVGVYKVIKKNTFLLYTNPIVKSAYSLLATETDNVLIGTADKGIYKWSPSTNQLIALNANADQESQPEVRKMAQTSNGDIWFVNNHNVYKMDSDGKRHQIFAPSAMPKLELFDDFKEIIVDSDDTIWLGTAHGLFAMNDLATDFEYIALEDQRSIARMSNHVTSLDYIANNQIWIGTLSGLKLWNSRTKELKTYYIHDPQNISTRPNNFIYITFQDKEQRFWVSTMAGLYLFDKESGTFSLYSDYFSEEQNLGIRFIKEDNLGRLWLFTPLGGSRLNPDNGQIQHFDKTDGLSGSRYFIDLVTQASDGTIFVSSRDGIHYFDPSAIPERQLNSEILLTNFEVLGSPKDRHKTNIDTSDIDLAYDQNYLKFEFATLDFLRARQIKYSYMLEGFDSDWIENGSNNTAVYTNLDGGDYTFRVKAKFKEDLWYDDELAVNVHIATPFWLQWWMYIVYVCFIALGIYYYIHRQKQSVLKLERQVAEKTASIAHKSDKLEAANKVKSQFLANMSHEIRTPLTTVIGQAEAIICRDIESQDIYREVEVIHDNGLHLLALLNDILDLTKIEENKFELELQTQDLHDLLENIHRMFSIEAQSKGLSFHTTKQLPVPLFVDIDGLRVKQILINLCSNAIKFTQQGEVRFNVALNNNELVFTISDTGIGMHEEQTQQIFENFTQADASISRRFGGSGLGLSLSNELARLMDGKITVESEFGRGSVFTFSMPVPNLSDAINLTTQNTGYDFSTPEHLFNGSILLAEDHFENRRLIARLLKKLGLKVLTAGDGLEAIELYLQHNPDLVLLDIQMPKVDGIQAYKSLRAQGCQQPIIALTANAMSHDVEHYDSLGFDGILKKPLNRQELVTTIAKYFTTQTSDAKAKASNALGNVDMSDLVLEFKNSLSTEYQQFVVNEQNRDLEKMATQAHRLIGASQLFHFPTLADAATKLENCIKNEDLEQLNALTQALLDELIKAAG